MSTLATIRDAIVATAAAVPGMGRVHAFERYVRGDVKFQELYLFDLPDGSQQLRGWWLRRKETQEVATTISGGAEINTWQLRGYMALQDDAASELAFDELIEVFRDAVRADPTFGGVCEPAPAREGEEKLVRVLDVGPVMFCGVLCHSAVLEVKTWSYR